LLGAILVKGQIFHRELVSARGVVAYGRLGQRREIPEFIAERSCHTAAFPVLAGCAKRSLTTMAGSGGAPGQCVDFVPLGF